MPDTVSAPARPLLHRERAALALLAVGSVAVMPGALNRFVFIKVAFMAGGAAIAFSAPRRGRLPPRVITILCVGTLILLVATIRESAPLYALVGRAPRFEGIFVLPVYLGAAVAGARLLGPDRAPGSTSWFMQWLALAAVLVGIEGALELAGQRPLASNLARPGSLLGNASDEGAWAVLVLGPLAAVAATTRKWPFVIGAIAASVALIASGSRGALLGAVVVAVVLFALEPRRSIRVVFLAGFLALALGSLATPATRDRVVASSPYSRETIEGRALLWTETTHLIEDNLVLGLGAGGYVNSIPSYHNLQWQLEVGPANPPDSPHNWLLQAGADGGLPLGLAALALAVAVLLGGLTSTRQQQTRGERAAVVGMLAGVSGYGAALLFHFTSPGTTPLAAMLAGVLVANSALGRDERRGEAPTSRRSRLLATARARNVFDAVMIAAFSALAVLLLLAAVAEIPLRVAIDDASSGNLGAADHNFHIATSLRPWDPSIAATAGHAFAVLATYAEPGAAKRGAPWAAIEVRDDPGGVTPLEDGAEIDTATHQLALAQTLLQRAANIDPTDPDVLLALGKVELQQGLQRRAEAVLEKAARYAPGDKAVREALEAARR